MEGARFATAINCIDGRDQHPVSEWLRDHVAVHYVDTVTEPGPDRGLAQGPVEAVAASVDLPQEL